jgi:hypothetical protein
VRVCGITCAVFDWRQVIIFGCKAEINFVRIRLGIVPRSGSERIRRVRAIVSDLLSCFCAGRVWLVSLNENQRTRFAPHATFLIHGALAAANATRRPTLAKVKISRQR